MAGRREGGRAAWQSRKTMKYKYNMLYLMRQVYVSPSMATHPLSPTSMCRRMPCALFGRSSAAKDAPQLPFHGAGRRLRAALAAQPPRQLTPHNSNTRSAASRPSPLAHLAPTHRSSSPSCPPPLSPPSHSPNASPLPPLSAAASPRLAAGWPAPDGCEGGRGSERLGED